MVGTEFGRDEAEINSRIEQRYGDRFSLQDLANKGFIIGTASQMVDQLGKMGEVGVERVMLQWLDLDALDLIEALAISVLPQIN